MMQTTKPRARFVFSCWLVQDSHTTVVCQNSSFEYAVRFWYECKLASITA